MADKVAQKDGVKRGTKEAHEEKDREIIRTSYPDHEQAKQYVNLLYSVDSLFRIGSCVLFVHIEKQTNERQKIWRPSF